MVKRRPNNTNNAATSDSASPCSLASILRSSLIVLVLVTLVGLQLYQSSLVTSHHKQEHEHEHGAVEDLSRVMKEVEHLKQQLKEAQQESATKALPVSIMQQQEAVPKIDSCRAVVQRMLDWNHCWWRYMATKDPHYTAFQDDHLICPISISTSPTKGSDVTMEPIGAPMMNLAFYEGQGFGRVVEHTTETCIMAFLLKRPCLINLSSRDPNYTWRSFLQENTYKWDPEPLYDKFPELTQQMDVLVGKIKDKENNDWQGRLNLQDYDQPTSLVFPMEQKFPKESYQQAIEYYHGLHPKRRHQILFSPNWGDAWFPKIPQARILQEEHNCQRPILYTLLQEALYHPTAMIWQLHQPRYNLAKKTAWEPFTRNLPAAATPRTTDPMKIPSILSHYPDNMNVPYGTLHIRLYFINLRRNENKEPPMTVAELSEHILSCMDIAKDMATEFETPDSSEFPVNWWFLGDNAQFTAQTAQEITDQQRENRQLAGKRVPTLNIFHDYNETAEQPSTQSKSGAAMALYGHRVLGGSMQDWMVLQQSEISIVMVDGSFGRSGSRGNGKVSTRLCGKNGVPHYLQIYRKVQSGEQRQKMCEGQGCK